jgi:type I restriction enzyme S subunit
MRQSILKKAFEGKLVEQDPTDEPAAILLERIKAENEKNKPVKKIKANKVKQTKSK